MENKNLITYFVSIAIGLILFGVYADTGSLFDAENTKEFVRILCDCFTVPGIILAGLSLLTWASTKGAYDMLSYGFSTVFMPFVNLFRGRKTEYKRFYDYKVEKDENRKPWNKEMFIVGLGFLALAGITLIVFYIV